MSEYIDNQLTKRENDDKTIANTQKQDFENQQTIKSAMDNLAKQSIVSIEKYLELVELYRAIANLIFELQKGLGKNLGKAYLTKKNIILDIKKIEAEIEKYVYNITLTNYMKTKQFMQPVKALLLENPFKDTNSYTGRSLENEKALMNMDFCQIQKCEIDLYDFEYYIKILMCKVFNYFLEEQFFWQNANLILCLEEKLDFEENDDEYGKKIFFELQRKNQCVLDIVQNILIVSSENISIDELLKTIKLIKEYLYNIYEAQKNLNITNYNFSCSNIESLALKLEKNYQDLKLVIDRNSSIIKNYICSKRALEFHSMTYQRIIGMNFGDEKKGNQAIDIARNELNCNNSVEQLQYTERQLKIVINSIITYYTEVLETLKNISIMKQLEDGSAEESICFE